MSSPDLMWWELLLIDDTKRNHGFTLLKESEVSCLIIDDLEVILGGKSMGINSRRRQKAEV